MKTRGWHPGIPWSSLGENFAPPPPLKKVMSTQFDVFGAAAASPTADRANAQLIGSCQLHTILGSGALEVTKPENLPMTV